MFGHRFFGIRQFGQRFFGQSAGVAAAFVASPRVVVVDPEVRLIIVAAE